MHRKTHEGCVWIVVAVSVRTVGSRLVPKGILLDDLLLKI